MDPPRSIATRAQLADIARAAVGAERRLVSASRLRGGSKKGVYRLIFDDDFTVIVYIWADAENYWPATHAGDPEGHADPFSPATGIDLFQAATTRLNALGIRTARVLLADRSHRRFPADIAVVEDVGGENLETRLRCDPNGAAAPLARLAEALEVMHRHTAPGFGKVVLIDQGGTARGRSCEQVVLGRALDDLAEAASRDTRVTRVHARMRDLLHGLAAVVPPRAEYGLIHGELGPDHVLIDRYGQPVLIDIEGLMFFDVEWEHAFLRIRFGAHYRWLTSDRLDERRLAFYELAMRLSLVAGPLRLLDGDFPARDAMRAIVEHNLQQALILLTAGGSSTPET